MSLFDWLRGDPRNRARKLAASSKVPSIDDLKLLPRWALVAFVARCARRAQPAFNRYASREHLAANHAEAVDAAIALAEQAACSATSPGESAHSIVEEAHAVHVAVAMTPGPRGIFKSPSPEGSAASLASRAAQLAIKYSDKVNCRAVLSTAHDEAITACNFFAVQSSDAVHFAIAFDYYLLKETAEAENWTSDTPVSQALLGPLWPDGPPEGWPPQEGSSTDDSR